VFDMKEEFVQISELVLPSDFKAVSQVELLVDKVCMELNLNESFYGNVLIAVSEAVNNAIEHGNKKNQVLPILMKVCDSIESVCFVVEDKGKGFDFENLPDPTSPDNLLKEKGRGVFLMKNLSDELNFKNNGSTVELYFKK
jgi:serine/threonine-protein kinase RsbW